MSPTRTPLDATRWHWQHGPIDLILAADGDAPALHAAYEACWARFAEILPELVAELKRLRAPVDPHASLDTCGVQGPVARRMWSACQPHSTRYITPMAAVAGSVADELIAAFARDGISRAYINNGGDIALYLGEGQQYRVGVFADLAQWRGAQSAMKHGPSRTNDLALDASLTLDATQPIRGIATSGWRGRSFSLGIADSVTVLARDAARADAAATMIANAVDVPHPGILRRPAASLKDDSDLGDIPVTVHVPALPLPLIDIALACGIDAARRLREQGLIEGAALFLQGQIRVTGIHDGTRVLPGRRDQTTRHTQNIQKTQEAPCSKYAAC
nr:hypothetical protein HUO10_006780 [Paraburkholderia busanensis]